MNFFEQQDRAHQNTNKLLGLFMGAVLFIVACVYLATILTINFSSLKTAFYPPCNLPIVQVESVTFNDSVRSNNISNNRFPGKEPRFQYSRNNYSKQQNSQSTCQISTSLWHPQVFFAVLITTSLVIGGASLSKTSQLKAGGAVIAVELGGRRVLPEIATESERQLLNVVEEMAIASGIPVPGVYLLDHEFGMNAFAAGFKPEDAVIGVTTGLLQNLSRDELQGVIAHEFSHILNGDMTMNLRLMGMLHGILFVYLTGRVLTAPRLGRHNSYGSISFNNNFVGYFGLALMLIGSSGLFCGRLIQSAISRQREFLADASSVQFTRNPDGIARALEKLADASSEIVSPYAETTSHMFFGSALGFNWLGDLFATHPTLEVRIQRVRGLPKILSKPQSGGKKAISNGVMGFAEVGNMVASKATPNQVRNWLDDLPSLLQTSLQEEYRSIAIIYALLLDSSQPQVRAEQFNYLQQVEDPAILSHINEIDSCILNNMEACWQLSLLDLAIDRLRLAPADTQKRLLKCALRLQELIKTNSWHSPLVYLIIEHRIHPQSSIVATSDGLLLQNLWPESLMILATLARASQRQSKTTSHAFQAGLFRLPSQRGHNMEMPAECNWQELQVCLEQLAHVRLPDRKILVTACAEVLAVNKTVTDLEADLLRMMAIVLDCPLPPLLNSFARNKSNRTQSQELSRNSTPVAR
jgi:Zn-dependent protease with chaperone function